MRALPETVFVIDGNERLNGAFEANDEGMAMAAVAMHESGQNRRAPRSEDPDCFFISTAKRPNSGLTEPPGQSGRI